MLLFITNDAITLGILTVTVAFILNTAKSPRRFWRTLYTYIPPLLLCYFIPALMYAPLGWISSETSQLYKVASQILLPASLLFFCLSLEFKAILQLGSKALWVFLAGTLGVILGGPLALWLVQTLAPNLLATDGDQLWRGLSTIAGSWIGGSANQAAMKEIYQVNDTLFAAMLVIDVITANVWMGILLYLTARAPNVDAWLGADNSALKAVQERVETFQQSVQRNPTVADIFLLLATGFGGVALSHWWADSIVLWLTPYRPQLAAYGIDSIISSFFWIVFIATTLGVVFSFTPLRRLEGVGASKWGSVFLYFLVATIGMKMNILEVYQNLGLFVVGIIWMFIHGLVIFGVGKLLKAPLFFIAVGSQANIGGAASAPIVAAAFHPSLAPIGVLLAVLGYALGTYGGIICALLMQQIAN